MAETVVRSGAKDSHVGIAARAFKTLGHAVNPLLLPLAGTGLLPIWGLVQQGLVQVRKEQAALKA